MDSKKGGLGYGSDLNILERTMVRRQTIRIEELAYFEIEDRWLIIRPSNKDCMVASRISVIINMLCFSNGNHLYEFNWLILHIM